MWLIGAFPKFAKNDKNVKASLENKYFYTRYLATARLQVSVEPSGVSSWEDNKPINFKYWVWEWGHVASKVMRVFVYLLMGPSSVFWPLFILIKSTNLPPTPPNIPYKLKHESNQSSPFIHIAR